MTSRVLGARGLSAHLLRATQPLLSSGNTPRILSAPLRALLQPRTLLACNGADAAPRVLSCSTARTDASSLRMLSTSAAQQVLRGSNDSAPARPAGHPRTRSSGRGAPQQASQSRGFASGPKQQPDPPSAQQTEQQGKAYSRLLRHLMTKIQMRGGPISLAEYMQDCLTSPHGGFYMSRDVFGSSGDFTTSPEISQMFGEMVGAWAAHTWSELGSPPVLSLVEMGPGRGTLMADMLRATARFKGFSAAVRVHMVEVSPALRQMQWDALRCTQPSTAPPPTPPPTPHSPILTHTQTNDHTQQQPQHTSSDTGITHGVCGINGAQVHWHATLDHVPKDSPTLYIAHEFFDALPVHQFVKDPQRGWLEKLVDTTDAARTDTHDTSSTSDSSTLTDSSTSTASATNRTDSSTNANTTDSSTGSTGSTSGGLRLVLSPSATPATALLVKRRRMGMSQEEADKCTAIEVSARGMALAESLAIRVGSQGGAALIIDYGQDKPYTDSIVAIREHKGVEVLEAPGTADLSAWVDFSALRQAALGSGASVYVAGPVTQGDWLHALGLGYRLQALLQRASPSQAQELKSGYLRLTQGTEEGGMGHAYKAMVIGRKGQPVAAGFAGANVQEAPEPPSPILKP